MPKADKYEFKTKEELDKILPVLSDTYRVRTLFLLNDGSDVQDIAKIIGRSRAGVYGYINAFRIAGLVHFNSTNLTERGKRLCAEIRDFIYKLDSTVSEILNKEYKERLHEAAELHQSRFGSTITKEELLKLAKKLKRNAHE